MSNLLQQLMKKAGKKQCDLFASNYSNTVINKRNFIIIYLKTFLGDFSKESLSIISDEEFFVYCHKHIDNYSLCTQEVDFLHKMVNCKYNELGSFIIELIRIYDSIDGLKGCQLGPNMKRCLDYCREDYAI